MAITLKSVGENKIQVIKLFREATGKDLGEVKSLVESVSETNSITFDVFDDDEKIVSEFNAIGAVAVLAGPKSAYKMALRESKNLPVAEEKKITESSNAFMVSNGDVSNMGREETLNLLVEVGKVHENLERLIREEKNVDNVINDNIKRAEEIRNAFPGKISAISLLVGVGVCVILTWFIGFIVGIIGLIIAFGFVSKKMKTKHFAEHGEEQNAEADEYLSHNEPLYERKAKIQRELEEFKASGQIEWAKDVVGEELFYPAGIEQLYILIKNRRADSLKEALNLYDETMHRARMEEMQAATQVASEIAATEAMKQTEYSKDAAISARVTSAAAVATAKNTKEISKNTRRFR